MVLSTRLVQVAVKEEATEGVLETFTAADLLAIYDPGFSPNIAKFTRTPVSPTYGNLPGVAGIQIGNINFNVELKGSGDVATPPEWDTALRACGYQRAPVSSAPIGAVTDGPFVQGEVCNDGSGWSGYAARGTEDGDGDFHFVTIAGALTGTDTITGEDSGASATTSAVQTDDVGFMYRPLSDGPISVSVGRYMNGTLAQISGGRGNVSVAGRQVGEPLFLNFGFEGAYVPFMDADMLTGESYDDTIPPVFMGANFSIQELQACIASINIDSGNNLAQRICANAPGGILATWITERTTNGTSDPEMTLVADHDFYGRLVDGTTGAVKMQIGEDAGNTIAISCPRVEYTNIGEGDRDSVAIANVTFGARKKSLAEGDDELFITLL